MRRLAFLALCLFTAAAAFAQTQANKKSSGPKMSRGERDAVQALLQSQAPDDRIKAADNLITKFADTPFKSFALYQEADAYEQKGDHTKAIVFAEQALDADPKDYDAEILIANVTAGQTKETDLDKTEKLAHAEKAANDALENLKTAPKPTIFQLTDENWTMMKNSATSQAWQALGTVAQVRQKPEEAIADFLKGLELNPDPVLMLRVGRAYLAEKKPDEAIVWIDKAAASPDASAQIKSIAASDKTRATQMKGH